MISNIEENQSLVLQNVISFRKKLDQQTSTEVSKEIDEILANNNAKKNGCTVTITHNSIIKNGQQIIDLEMMIPLDKEISAPVGFEFLSEFVLKDAFKVRIEGNPQQMQSAVESLAKYIKNKKLQPNTPLYVVTVKEAKTQFDIDSMVTDIYTGVEKF